ncbi:MAG: 1,4-alpha-glucan branching protein GlgB [Cyanobacteria bacterium SZAS TMP-1]|nr:1,4-alpha-glucan branching protein GlgB [Cyanobacteria bacterium SZAS TMP-1]
MTASPTDNARAFISDFDVHLFCEGTHYRLYEKLGAHPAQVNGVKGTHFAVWAPNATAVSVIGDFNKWDASKHPMQFLASSGLWTCFIPGLDIGTIYKYYIQGHNGYAAEKCDPMGFASEMRPKTASVVWELDKYKWQDAKWQEQKLAASALDAPISIYEVHLGSWMRVPEDGNRWLTYREMADKLVAYVVSMGFTHVEVMPVSEHPLDASWGYQTTGYFATTSRFGTPDDFMYLVDKFHQAGIGVLVDWVPAHFPKDGHALGLFDGTHLYEHADPRQGEHREWGTYVFNYGRYEVRNFLLSNAMFWFDRYHIDGLRVDAVASMLYLDYARKHGEWLPNQYGGRENIEAIDFMRMLNEKVYAEYPAAMMVAEESTAWPLVTRPTYVGGLGFGYKWDMGWMNDTLTYMALDPVHRKYHHDKLTFRSLYSFSENYILPLSHDEVVHLKHSLASKMPGDAWQQFANLRLLYGYQWTSPGKKLLFMGGEMAQWIEWNCDQSLDWHLLEYPQHNGVQQWLSDLNRVYREEPAMHEGDCHAGGFEWIDCQDTEQSILCFLRKGKDPADTVLVACNFTPLPRPHYRIGVPHGGFWKELLNSDALQYGGSGIGNLGGVYADDHWHHGRQHSVSIVLPPLSVVVLKAAKQ